jgi:2,4-dienoyl-CoA reductase-like NADH-dependent reductase (Old Yellow Enzyme family)/pyruvate/2-oxoglutarate dehydrogenase complex dihydrolipoamide dehydrogenase (E3) component
MPLGLSRAGFSLIFSPMSERFPHVFTPATLRHKTLKNRIVFGAHTNNMSEAGLPQARTHGYYLERARGGAGMIVVEPVPVHPTGVLTRGNYRTDDDSVIPWFRRITESCRAQGTVMLQQLYHVGAHADADNSFEPGWSPSGLPSYFDADVSHAMSEREIEEMIDAFARAAWRCREAGFDGVELFAAYNALIDQFWTPLTNRRDDRWGGSFENRMRFSSAIIDRIRERCGEDFIIGLAVSADPDIAGNLSVEALQEIVAWHDARGLIDYVTCGTGSYFDFTKIIPPSPYADMLGAPYAAALKSVVKHALVQAESRITTPENAEQLIAAGKADLVSLVRAQIADPHLANKAAADRPEEIRPCIACNQLCWGRRSRDYWISCLVNPSAGREFEWGGDRFEAAQKPRQVLVVGGGVAGLEAARVAAARGHRVTLVEKSPRLGGQFALAGRQPTRDAINRLLDWYEHELMRSQVEVRLATELAAEQIRAAGFDVVVLATGAKPSRNGFQRALPDVDRLPGVERADVFDIRDVLAGEAALGHRVLVLDDLGGGWPATGTALLLAERGHAVAIVTRDPMLAKAMVQLKSEGPIRKRLAEAGVKPITDAALLRWSSDGARFRGLLDGREWSEAFDSLVLATAAVAEDGLARALADDATAEVHAIGDCVAPRRASLAIYEGRKLARLL